MSGSSGSVGRDAVVLTGARAGAALLSAGWLFVAARYLPQAAFADLAVLLALAVIGVALCDRGYGISLGAAVARSPAGAGTALRYARARRARTSVWVAAAVFISFLVVTQTGSLLAPTLIAVSVVATVQHAAVATALRASGSVGAEAGTELGARLGVLVVGGALVAATGDLVVAAAAYAVADLACLWRLGRCARALGDGPLPEGLGGTGARSLAISVPLATIYWRVDIWLLALVAPAREVAVYGAAFRVLDGLLVAPTVLGALSAREIARAPAHARTSVTLRLAGAATGVTLVPALVILAVPTQLLDMLFGPTYVEGRATLMVLALAALPSAGVLIGTQAAGIRRPRALASAMAVTLVVSSAANAFVLPAHGALGAAVTTLVCQVGLAVYLLAASCGTDRSQARFAYQPSGSCPSAS